MNWKCNFHSITICSVLDLDKTLGKMAYVCPAVFVPIAIPCLSIHIPQNAPLENNVSVSNELINNSIDGNKDRETASLVVSPTCVQRQRKLVDNRK